MVLKWDGDRVEHTLDPLLPRDQRLSLVEGVGSMELSTSQARAQMRSDELTRLGARARALRLERGLTQQQVADAVGVHRVNLNKFENGRSDLGVSHVRSLGEALDVDPGRLFE